MLTREQILQADDLGIQDVEVQEWGGSVRIRGLTVGERDKWAAGFRSKNKDEPVPEDAKWRLILVSCVGEDGKPLFVEGDLPLLMGKSVKAMDRVWLASARLSKLLPSDMDDAVKN